MIIFIHILVFSLFALYFNRLFSREPLGAWFLPGLLIKCSAGLLVGWIYLQVYAGGDTWRYHEEAQRFSQLIRTQPMLFFSDNYPEAFLQSTRFRDQPRAFYFSEILGRVYFMTGDRYAIASIYYSLFSFLGLFLLANALSRMGPRYESSAVIAFILFPSVVFWSSGILKESLAVGAMAGITGLTLMFDDRQKPVKILYGILIMFLFLITWKLKYFYAAVFTPIWCFAVIFHMMGKLLPAQQRNWKWAGLLIILLGAFSFSHPNLRPSNLFSVLVDNHEVMLSLTESEARIHYSALEATPAGIFRNVPMALFSGLFGPVASFGNVWQALTSLENVILLGFFLLGLTRLRKYPWKGHELLFLYFLIFIVVEAVMISLSTPIYGTLIRYKAGYLGLWVWMIFLNFELPSLRRPSALFKFNR